MKLKIKKPVNIYDKRYDVGDEYEPTENDIPLIIRLNEKGFINPLTREELLRFIDGSYFEMKSKKKKEEK